VPKAGPPRTKRGSPPARRFRRTGRSLTQWRGRRRIQTTTKRNGGLPKPSFGATARELSFRVPLPEMRSVSGLPSQPTTVAASGGTEDLNSSVPGDAPDASAEFRSEFAALLAFYAARIAAARSSLPPSVAAAIVQALMNEQAVALRALTDRRHAASQKQRDEKPERPTGNVQRKGDDLKSP
jgi:hypothetical protein